jgi:AraC-like DNA-binding protein
MSTLVRADDFPAGERLERWREVLSRAARSRVPANFSADNQADFRFKLRYHDLGSVRVMLFTALPYRTWRTPKLIRRSDPEQLLLGMPFRGHATLDHHDRHAHVPEASFSIFDSSHPYDIRVRSGSIQGLLLSFPRTLLPLPSGHLSRLTAVTMPASQGIGTLTSRLLVQLAAGMDHYTPAEAARLSTAALEVLAIRLAHELDGDRRVPPETHRRALLVRIHAFIQQHLGDPELSPGVIAAAHHVSLRYLHKLFSEQGETVAGWIRARRLEGCRRDLADPALAARPVAGIASRWGLGSPTHFYRLFKEAYGMPPHEYRRSRQAPPAP